MSRKFLKPLSFHVQECESPLDPQLQSTLRRNFEFQASLPDAQLRIVNESGRGVLQVRDYQLKSEYRLKRMAQ